jgi:hypothetical protein
LVAVVIDAHSPVIWGASAKSVETLAATRRTLLLLPTELRAELERLGLGANPYGSPARDPSTASYANVTTGPERPGSPDVQPEASLATQRSLALAAERAIAAVRAIPELESLRKGGHLHFQASSAGGSVLARSFAAIYVLILSFDGPMDELRAKRAVALSLPTIERLVLALPPLDPEPRVGGAAAIRLRPQKRR